MLEFKIKLNNGSGGGCQKMVGENKHSWLRRKEKENLLRLTEGRQSTECLVLSSWGIRQTSMHRFCPAS